MKLHENKGVFRQTITTIADRTDYRRDVLEKDYYVVLMLKELSDKQREGCLHISKEARLFIRN